MYSVAVRWASKLIVTTLICLTWWWLVLSAAAPRTSDNGVFLSVAGALADGVPLYEGVVEYKDPLFFYALAAALGIGPAAAQLLDVFWFACLATGAFLLSKTITRATAAVVVGFVAAPVVVLGTAYQPGMTNLPGTALVCLGMGLLVSRAWWASGIVFALAIAAKITTTPLVVAILVCAIALPHLRSRGLRATAVFAASLLGLALVLLAVGALDGYRDGLVHNLRYSRYVMVYFDLTPDVLGHLERWAALAAPTRWWTVLSLLFIATACTAMWAKRSGQLTALLLWLWVSIAGTFLTVAYTYVWRHHWQAAALPAVIALIAAVGFASRLWGNRAHMQFMAAALACLLAIPLGGWIPPQHILETFKEERAGWSSWRDQLDVVSLEARLLQTVPQPPLAVARLGSNDDASFLLNLPEQATLVCPRFHFYDFSPVEDFSAAYHCLDGANVVLLTDQFLAFKNGPRGAVVAPIVTKVNAEFTCLRVDDRQICSRR